MSVKKPERPRRSVPLLLDRAVQSHLREAERRLDACKAEHDAEAKRVGGLRRAGYDDAELPKALVDAVAQAEAELAHVRAEADAATLRFTFRTLSPEEKRQLHDEHPATDEQVEEAKAAAKEAGEDAPVLPVRNEETYWPAYLQLACVEPELDDGWFAEVLDDEDPRLSDGELLVLLSAARQGDMDYTVADWGKGSSETLSSRPSSPTASPKASLTDVSWDAGQAGKAS